MKFGIIEIFLVWVLTQTKHGVNVLKFLCKIHTEFVCERIIDSIEESKKERK